MTPFDIPPLQAKPQQSSQGFVPLPYFSVPHMPMELYNPELHLPTDKTAHLSECPFNRTLPFFLAAKANKNCWLIPRLEECKALWEKYDMLSHIQAHSSQVALFAKAMAKLALEQGATISVEAVYAAGLLHDLGKTYCIEHKGNHAQLGAAWVMHETQNPLLAQAVLYHVHWPWEDIIDDCMDADFLFPVMAVIYADKRVKHDTYVTLEERFDDLQQRYGKTELARQRIHASYEQGKHIEMAFKRRFGVCLHERSFDSGRLV